MKTVLRMIEKVAHALHYVQALRESDWRRMHDLERRNDILAEENAHLRAQMYEVEQAHRCLDCACDLDDEDEFAPEDCDA